jgi:hypothetical protein
MLKGKHSPAVKAATATVALLLAVAPAAAAGDASTYRHIGTVTEPAIKAIATGKTPSNPTGLFASADISWVDNEREFYYLADRSNNAIDMVDASDGSFVQFLGQGKFSGIVQGSPSRSGPDGVLTDKNGNVWAGDGYPGAVFTAHSSIKAFNPKTGEMIANIDNGGAARADEEAYGPVRGGRLLMANPNEPTNLNPSVFAFVTLVNTANKSIIGKVFYDEPAHSGLPAAGHGFATFYNGSQHGLEQPVFMDDQFYLNVPSTIQNNGGEIDVFDFRRPEFDNSPQITAVLPLTSCGGTGLAALPHGRLLVECGDSARIIDTMGKELARFPELGGTDEIWYNPGDGNAYFALGVNNTLRPGVPAGLGVLDVAHNKSLGVSPLAGAQGLGSLAVDAHNNRIYMRVYDNPDNGAGGIAMMHRAGHGQGSED